MDLQTTLELFDFSGPEERLELLMDYGKRLAPLPEDYAKLRDSGAFIVHECQSPVFFLAEINDTAIHIEVDAPAEAAIARGFATLIKLLFDGKGVPVDEEVPENMLAALQIEGLLGMQRRRGLSAIYKKLTDQLNRIT